jgi:2-haloacid dehalogenase
MPAPSLITFDCYGTLIDWYGGLRATLVRLVGPSADLDRLCGRYVELEMEVESGPYLPYRQVMERVLQALMDEEGRPLAPEHRGALGRALPGWHTYPEVTTVLSAMAGRFPLAILSNIDDDLLDASVETLAVPLAHRVTAEAVRAYKPARAHFERILEVSGLSPGRILHVAGSLLHDVIPARDLGFRCLWINRLGEESPGWLPAEQELPDLTRLPEIAAP